MQDYLIRATDKKGHVRILIADTTALVKEACKRHDTWPAPSAALGRTLTAGCLIGATLKGEDDMVTIRIDGNGPAGGIVVSANSQGTVRGYIQNPHVDLPANSRGKLDVAGCVGTDGFLTITKSIGVGEPYSSSVNLVSGEIGEDFAYYYTSSEQTPSAFALGVLVDPDLSVKAAGGLMLQVLPDTPADVIDGFQARLEGMASMTSLISAGKTPEDILSIVAGNVEVEILERKSLSFRCTCSKERIEGILISLGKGELEDLYREQGGAELHCHFCNNIYNFSAEEIKELVDKLD